MVTASQLRAGRALIGLSIDAMAAETGLSVFAIEQAELRDASSDPGTHEQLRGHLEARGVVFLGAGEGDPNAGPGVRLGQLARDEGIRPQNLNAANDD